MKAKAEILESDVSEIIEEDQTMAMRDAVLLSVDEEGIPMRVPEPAKEAREDRQSSWRCS
jgi:hypothetical protein